MKKFTSRKTGEVIYGTFKESTATHKKAGWDWSLVFEGGKRRYLFSSIQEFVESYSEEINPVVDWANKIVSDMKRKNLL